MKKALALGLVVVLGVGVASFAQMLSGAWDSTVTIVPSAVSFGIRSELIVTYAVSGWSFSSDTVLTEAGWVSQRFDASGALGEIALGSVATFNPAALAFASWIVTSSASLADVSLSGTCMLLPNNTKFILVGSGTADTVDARVAVTFGDQTLAGCDFNWTGVDIAVGFPFSCADITSAISFGSDGFSYAEFMVAGIAIPSLPWATLAATLQFTVAEKTLRLAPSFDFGVDACFELYVEQLHSTTAGVLTLGDIEIGGLGLKVTIGVVDLYGLSYWGNGTAPTILDGYWEMYEISTSDDGCCSGALDFSVAVFFSDVSDELFGVSLLKADISVNATSNFVFSTGISIDLAAAPDAFAEWTVGFAVTW
jgi:hypothetical protein